VGCGDAHWWRHSPLPTAPHKTRNGVFTITCRNRHCPKCQGRSAERWLEARQSELLPVEYFHVVFTLPAQIADIAYQNKATVYNILFQAASETLLRIGADSKHLGARLGITAVLHTWGSAMTHHPHLHCIVPGGGLSEDKHQWIRCRRGFFLPVRVLSRLFRRLFLEKLRYAHHKGELQFYGKHSSLVQSNAFSSYLQPVQSIDWVVYAKPPFSGPESVLTYLSRYTHRVAIANSRLLSVDAQQVRFKYKDYRVNGRERYKSMTLKTDEFIRRFLIHVLPSRFHRIRHYGLFSNTTRCDSLNQARALLSMPPPAADTLKEVVPDPVYVCRHCKHAMIIIEILEPIRSARGPP